MRKLDMEKRAIGLVGPADDMISVFGGLRRASHGSPLQSSCSVAMASG